MSAPQLSITHRLLSEDRQAEAMEARIVQYLRARSGVTLIELARDVPGFAGDHIWASEGQNLVIWEGLSKRAISTIVALISSRQITPTVTTWMVYAYDGHVLGLPIAKRLTRHKKPHWLPIVFSGKTRAANGES